MLPCTTEARNSTGLSHCVIGICQVGEAVTRDHRHGIEPHWGRRQNQRLAFTAGLCRDRGHQLLYAGALACWADDFTAVVFAQTKIQLRFFATIQTFVLIRRH